VTPTMRHGKPSCGWRHLAEGPLVVVTPVLEIIYSLFTWKDGTFASTSPVEEIA